MFLSIFEIKLRKERQTKVKRCVEKRVDNKKLQTKTCNREHTERIFGERPQKMVW